MLPKQNYERVAIAKLCVSALPTATLHAALQQPDGTLLTLTGAGYYLELSHSEIPDRRVVCNTPNSTGQNGNQKFSFVAFMESGRITLECYSFGDYGVSEEFRQGGVSLSAT